MSGHRYKKDRDLAERFDREAIREARQLPPIAELSPAEKKIEKRAAQMHKRFKRHVAAKKHSMPGE